MMKMITITISIVVLGWPVSSQAGDALGASCLPLPGSGEQRAGCWIFRLI